MKLAYKFIPPNPSAQLALIVTLSGLIYLLVFTLPFPLHRYYNTIPPVDYAKLTNYSQLGFIAYLGGIGALFWLYVRAIRLTMPGSDAVETISPRLIFGSSGILALISLFAYPLTAIDLFIYAIWTRGWALYGLNPLTTTPEMLPPNDPWLGLAAEWLDAASPYGPLWEVLSLTAFYLSGGDFLAHLFALKILATLAYLGCVWLIYQTLQILQPQWAIAGTIAFAWNPLVLLESVQNAHNDIVMVFFFLGAVFIFTKWFLEQTINIPNGHRSREAVTGQWQLQRTNDQRQMTEVNFFQWGSARLPLVCLFLALSVLVKFVTIITIPFFLLAIACPQPTWLRRFGVILGYGLLLTTLIVLPILPLWPGWENWAVLETGGQAGRSLLALLILSLRDSLGPNPAFDLSRIIILAIYSLIYLYSLSKATLNLHYFSPPPPSSNLPISQSPNLQFLIPNYLLPPTFHTLFWYVLLAAPVFHAWYLLWFFPIAVLLLPKQRALIPALTFSLTALLIIPYFETIRVWYPFLLRNHFVGHLIGVPLLILPPTLVALWPIFKIRPIRPTSPSEV